MERLKDCHPFMRYIEDIQLKNKFFSELAHLKETWVCFVDEEDKQIYSKTEPGVNLISMFYRFKVPTNMFSPLSLLSEIDLIREWVPSIIRSDEIKKLSPYRRVLHVQREFPMPMTNREIHICASATLVKERKGAMIMLRSINNERSKHWGVEEPPENTEFIRARMIKGFMYVEHIDDNNCWFHGYINIDPKFDYIPDFVINFTIKRVLYVLIGKLQSKEIFENDILKKRISEKPEFYEKLKNKLREMDINVV